MEGRALRGAARSQERAVQTTVRSSAAPNGGGSSRRSIDRWTGHAVELTGVVAALLGAIALASRLGVWDEVSRVAIETGAGGLLIAAGASLVLERRGRWHHVVAARLAALLYAAPPVVALLLLVTAGYPARAIDLTLPAALLFVVVAVALGTTLPSGRTPLRLRLVGSLAALAVALATVMDVSQIVYGDRAVVFAPISRPALAGLAVLAAGLLVDTIHRWIAELGAPVRWLPTAVTLFLGTFAVGLWSAVTVLEDGPGRELLAVPLSRFFIAGGLALAGLAGLAIFLSQESLARLLDEARRLRLSEKRYRELLQKQSRAALEKSEARYRELLDTVPVGVFQSTTDGELLIVNPAMVHLLGYLTPHEVLGRDLLRGITIENGGGESLARHLERHGTVEDLSIRLRRRDGGEIIGQLSARLLSEQSLHDEPVITGTLTDVTEQRRLEQRVRGEPH